MDEFTTWEKITVAWLIVAVALELSVDERTRFGRRLATVTPWVLGAAVVSLVASVWVGR